MSTASRNLQGDITPPGSDGSASANGSRCGIACGAIPFAVEPRPQDGLNSTKVTPQRIASMHRSSALALTLLALAGNAAASHDESVGARFVQPGGVDAGNCLDHHAPCVSMQYALAQAEPGNTLKVGAGIFDLRGVDPETFLHGPVHALGRLRRCRSLLRVAAAAGAVDRHGRRLAVSQCARRAGLLLGRERSRGAAQRVLVRGRRPAPAGAGRRRRVRRRACAGPFPVPQPRLRVADSARAVLEPARLGCERLGLRRSQRQPRVRRLGTAQRDGDRRGHGPRRIRARS